MPYKMANGKWRAHKQIDGKRKTKVFERKADAVKWEATQDPSEWSREQTPTACLLDWATRYLDHVKERCVAKTYEEKRLCFRRLLNVIPPDKHCESITLADAAAFLGKQAHDRSGHGANRDRKNLAAAWKWGARYMGLPRENPFRDTERFGADREPRHIPTLDEMDKVMATAEGEVKTFLLAMLHTAARRGELLRLRWDDVDLEAGTIRLGTRKRTGGGMEYDVVRMTGVLAMALREHKRQARSVFVFADKDGQPFKYRRWLMPRLCKRAGVRPFGFHAIRHLSASMMARAGVDLVTIQAILRHKAASTTARYLREIVGVEARIDHVFAGRVVHMKKAPGVATSEG